MILDLIVVGVIVLAFFISARKGLVKSVWRIAALIITIALVTAFKTPMVNYLSQTNIADRIYDTIVQRLTPDELADIKTDNEDNEKSIIPAYIINELTRSEDLQKTINRGTDETAQKLTLCALQIIATVALFIIIRVFLMAAFMILDGMSKLPLINQANALLGGLLGVVNILAVIYIACALLSLFAKSEVIGLIEQSYIVKYFYNYNILLQLIMKI